MSATKTSMKSGTLKMFEVLCFDKHGRPFVLERMYSVSRVKVDRLAIKWSKKLNQKTWVGMLLS